MLLKYKPDDRFFGWAAYTLSRSVRTDGPGEEEHPTPWDQTHVLTVLGNCRSAGAGRSARASASCRAACLDTLCLRSGAEGV